MKQEIFLKASTNSSQELKVVYTMNKTGKYHHIDCVVDTNHHKPAWLELYKFNFTSLRIDNHYSLLFEDFKYNRNLKTIHFLDQVYASIMQSNQLSFDQ